MNLGLSLHCVDGVNVNWSGIQIGYFLEILIELCVKRVADEHGWKLIKARD